MVNLRDIAGNAEEIFYLSSFLQCLNQRDLEEKSAWINVMYTFAQFKTMTTDMLLTYSMKVCKREEMPFKTWKDIVFDIWNTLELSLKKCKTVI